MAGLNTGVQQKVLDHIVGKTSYTIPSVWVALFTAAPSDAGGGTECTGGSYARKSTAAADWVAATSATPSVSANATVITFVTPTGSWGTATHFALMSSLAGTTSADYIGWAALGTPQAIGTGNSVTFAIGALTVTLD